MRVFHIVASLMLAAAVVACGGGSEDGAPPSALPAPVTHTVPASGATVVVALADGGRATLEFPAGAFAVDTPVTVAPAAPSPGEWTRFSLTPGAAALAKPLKIRVRPPAGVTAAQVPILQLVTGAGASPLRTTALANGEYEVVLLPALAAPDGAAPSPARAMRAVRRLADEERGGTTLAGTGFLFVCQAPQSALDDALRVIDNAASASSVLRALSALALIEERCAGPGLDENTLLVASRALQDLAARLPGLYRNALAAWQAVDYLDAEIQLETFRRGVRRLLALCAAAHELGAGLACPATDDFEPQYVELAFGFGNAASARETTGGLRLLFDQLVSLPAEAELFGMSEASALLRHALARIADRLMDRDYELCNHGALFEWRQWIEGGGASNRNADMLRRALAYCGITATAARIETAANGAEQRLDERSYEPGAIDGNGRIVRHSITVPRNGQVVVAVGGRTTRCSRVLGAPEVTVESVSLRVGSVEIGTVALRNRSDTEGPELREARFDLQELARSLGRAADSMAPIVIDVWKRAVQGLPCADASGGTLTVTADEEKLYTLELNFPRDASGWSGTIQLFASGTGTSEHTVELLPGQIKRDRIVERVESEILLNVDFPRVPFGQTAAMDLLSGTATFRVHGSRVITLEGSGPHVRCPYREVQEILISYSWSGGTPTIGETFTLRVDADGQYALVTPIAVGAVNPNSDPQTFHGTSSIHYTNLGGPPDCPPSRSETGPYRDENSLDSFVIDFLHLLPEATGVVLEGRIASTREFRHVNPGGEGVTRMIYDLQAR